MSQIEIKKVSVSEINKLQSISRHTFYETFAEVNTESDMKMYLDESFSIEKLTSEFLIPNSEFYFAIDDTKVVGYLKLNFGQAQTELKDRNYLEIERIYVLKEFLGKKVGQTLFDTALQVAAGIKVEYIWLGVWEKNERAIAFYKKNGFTAFDKHMFLLGDDEQTDIMMKLRLSPE